MWDSFFRIQVAMEGVVSNFPNRWVGAWLRMLVFPKGLTLNAPHDKWALKVAELLITPGAARDRLTAGVYIPRDENDVVGRLEFAMEAVIKSDPFEARMRKAQKEGKLPQRTLVERRLAALNQKILTQEEYDHLVYTDRLRRGRDQGGRPSSTTWPASTRETNNGKRKSRKKAGRRVHVVDGARTPFLKAQKGLGPFTGSDLAVAAGRPLLLRQPFGPEAFDEVIVGAAMPSADEANIGPRGGRCAWAAATRFPRGP
jgi:hypothetical protein